MPLLLELVELVLLVVGCFQCWPAACWGGMEAPTLLSQTTEVWETPWKRSYLISGMEWRLFSYLVDGDQVHSACWERLGHTHYRKAFGELASKFKKFLKTIETISHLKSLSCLIDDFRSSKMWDWGTFHYISVGIGTRLNHCQVKTSNSKT